MRNTFDETAIEQVRDAVKHCSFSYNRCSSYCRICPYNNYGTYCMRILRMNIIQLINRVIPDREVE